MVIKEASKKGYTVDEEDKIMPWKDKNKYLAEDRIMCLEIVAKIDDIDSNRNFYLKYIPGSKCLTDPPKSLKKLKPLIMLLNFTLINNFNIFNIISAIKIN